MMRRLDVEHRDFSERADKLLDLVKHLTPLAPHYRKMTAEVVMLRLFSLLEETIATSSAKICCGTVYLDGAPPILKVRCASISDALDKMRTHGRPKRRQLKWTKAKDIKENPSFIVDPTDGLSAVVDRHGTIIDEMRRVRNHIAHNTRSTRQEFNVVVRRRYGADVNAITAGIMLLSAKHSPSLTETYIITAKVIIKELLRA